MVRKMYRLYYIKLVFISIMSVVVVVLVVTNVWWIIDCKICFGGICRFSVCQSIAKRDSCRNTCRNHDSLNTIQLKSSRTSLNGSIAVPSSAASGRWQALSDYGVRVYSAFAVHNNTGVAIVAQIQVRNNYDQQFSCLFSADNSGANKSLFESEAKFELFEENYSEYGSATIECQLLSADYKFVQLRHRSPRDTPVETDYIEINYPKRGHLSSEQIVICVRPLFGGYDSIQSLIEFIAYYRVNGIDTFVFYNDSLSPRVSQLLRHMSAFVEINEWRSSLGYAGRVDDQLTSVNDCFRRHSSSIMLFVDIDEFILPFGRQTLRQFIIGEKFAEPKVAALSVNNVFFCCEFNEGSASELPRILSHVNRQWSVWPNGLRSKVVVLRSHLLEEVGVHGVTKLSALADRRTAVKHVHQSNALMFHYRSCCGVRRTPTLRYLSVRTRDDFMAADRRMLRFSDEIVNFINQYIQY